MSSLPWGLHTVADVDDRARHLLFGSDAGDAALVLAEWPVPVPRDMEDRQRQRQRQLRLEVDKAKGVVLMDNHIRLLAVVPMWKCATYIKLATAEIASVIALPVSEIDPHAWTQFEQRVRLPGTA